MSAGAGLLLVASTLTVARAQAGPPAAVRKIRDNERPRARNDALLLVRARVEAEYVAAHIKKRGQMAMPRVSMRAAMEAELKRTKKAAPTTWKDYRPIRDRLVAQRVFDLEFYKQFQQAVQGAGLSDPDIDTFFPDTVSPGEYITIGGVNFGPPQGKVLLEIKTDDVIELTVTSWTETAVTAYIEPLIGDVPLRPYYGKLWLATGSGKTSNAFPIMYYPIYSLYWLTYDQRIGSWCCGDTADGPALPGAYIGDPDFSLLYVTMNHYGDGHAELKYPNAAGQSLEQGYHMGCRGHCSGSMTIFFQAWGPKGIVPPTPSDEHTGGWFYMGDLPGHP